MHPDELTLRVWDLPTRVFHWVLALCVVGSVVTAKVGGNATAWHFRLGYTVFALLLFRAVWGFIGGHWSRFKSFAYAPSAALRYWRGQSRPHEFHDVGHSPMGALSVFGLLGGLALQVGSGLFADDDISNAGPLVKFASDTVSQALTKWHNTFGQWLVISLVVLHLAAIAYYRVRRQRDLVRPMWSGDKPLSRPGLSVAAPPASVDTSASRAVALTLAIACAGVVGWVVVGLGG